MIPVDRDHGDVERVRVVVGRFSPVTLLGLDAALGRDGRILVLASNLGGKALEDAVKREVASVVVLDVGAASSLLARLNAQRPAPAVLVLARGLSELSRTMLIDAGVTCVTYEATIGQLVAAVHRAAELKRTMSAGHSLGDAKMNLLTDREKDVLALLSRGASYLEVAEDLSMSVSTAKGHFGGIKRKLGVGSKRDLIGIDISGTPQNGWDRRVQT